MIHGTKKSIGAVALAMVAFALIGTTPAWAVLLGPGGAVAPTPTVSPAGATLLADTGAVPFTAVDGISFAGTLRSRVYNADPANPFGPAALTFTFLLTNAGPDTLERLVTVDYSGFLTDANFSSSAPPGAIPITVDRSVSGKVVGWDYTGVGGIAAGGASATLVLHTNAPLFKPVVNSIINGSVATAASFGPDIPEPTTLSAIGVAGLALIARRRSR
jgi:hypothetical protein